MPIFENGEEIARAWDDPNRAALIVEAVNSYDANRALLEAATASRTALLNVHTSFESDGFVSGRAMCGECEASWQGEETAHNEGCRGGYFLATSVALRAAIERVKGEGA